MNAYGQFGNEGPLTLHSSIEEFFFTLRPSLLQGKDFMSLDRSLECRSFLFYDAVLTADVMKMRSRAFWDIAPCSLV
jgi:hypothetical protein